MGRSELTVSVDLSTKFRSLTWTTLMSGTNTLPPTKKNIYIYTYGKMKDGVSIHINKTTVGEKTVKLEINTNPFHAIRGSRGFLQQTNCRAP